MNQNFLEGDPEARKIEAPWPARLFGRARSVYIRRHPHHMRRKDRISLGYEPVPQAPLSGADRAAARAGSFDDTLLTLLFAIRDWVTPPARIRSDVANQTTDYVGSSRWNPKTEIKDINLRYSHGFVDARTSIPS